MKRNDFTKSTNLLGNTPLMPVFFIGHGSPMNAIADNPFTRSLHDMGRALAQKPEAILVVSAHWLTKGTQVMISEKPRTIHDFGGFPSELYAIQYPAPGSPEFAMDAMQQVTSARVTGSDQWGLDHGSWAILRHLFPDASIPVFQLSIDYTKPPRYHFNLAKELRGLRHKGVLIIGSGNIVHNLYHIDFSDHAKPYEWALEFDAWVTSRLESGNFEGLIDYFSAGNAARLSVPTNDHYLPLLYSVGLADREEEINFTFEEIQHAGLSMRSFQIG